MYHFEPTLASFSQLTKENTERQPAAPSHILQPIDLALRTAFADQAGNAASTIINGLAREEMSDTGHMPISDVIQGLEEIALSSENERAARFGAVALCSLLAINYRPTQSLSSNRWERKGEAFSTAARETLARISSDNPFYNLAVATEQHCVAQANAPEHRTDELAFELMDLAVLHETDSPASVEAVAQPETQCDSSLRAEDRDQLVLTANELEQAVGRLQKTSWLPKGLDLAGLAVKDVYDGADRVAVVADLLPYNQKIADIRDKSQMSPEEIEKHLLGSIVSVQSPALNKNVAVLREASVQLYYKKNTGPSERIIRVYFMRIGNEGEIPIYGLIGASRTKKYQAELLSVLQNERVSQHDIRG